MVAMLVHTQAPPSTAAEGAVRDALAAVDRGIACLQAARTGLQAALAFARGEPDPADQEAPDGP